MLDVWITGIDEACWEPVGTEQNDHAVADLGSKPLERAPDGVRDRVQVEGVVGIAIDVADVEPVVPPPRHGEDSVEFPQPRAGGRPGPLRKQRQRDDSLHGGGVQLG